MIGIFTAVVAALLLVGVAWASSDSARDDAGSSSTQVSPTSDVSNPGSQMGEVTGTSLQDRLTRSGGDDNDGSTPTTIDDHDGDRDDSGSDESGSDDHGGDRDDSGSDESGSNDRDDSGSDDDHGGDRDD
jgi:hypothetical protein